MIALYNMDRGICSLRYRSFPAFSETRDFPEISMVIDQGSPLPMLVFYIPRFQKTFPEFSGDLPIEKMKIVPSVPGFIDPVFTKTSPKRSFSVIQNERFGLVFAKTGSIISGTGRIELRNSNPCLYPETTAILHKESQNIMLF